MRLSNGSGSFLKRFKCSLLWFYCWFLFNSKLFRRLYIVIIVFLVRFLLKTRLHRLWVKLTHIHVIINFFKFVIVHFIVKILAWEFIFQFHFSRPFSWINSFMGILTNLIPLVILGLIWKWFWFKLWFFISFCWLKRLLLWTHKRTLFLLRFKFGFRFYLRPLQIPLIPLILLLIIIFLIPVLFLPLKILCKCHPKWLYCFFYRNKFIKLYKYVTSNRIIIITATEVTFIEAFFIVACYYY